MHKRISWTERLPDGVKREVRVEVSHKHLKWQCKRKDQDAWDYGLEPDARDWDQLEDILRRRAARGRATDLLASVRAQRAKAES